MNSRFEDWVRVQVVSTEAGERRRLASGFLFLEGPRWHEGRLWLSDMYGHRVYTIAPDGTQRVVVELDDRPSGLGFAPDGVLLVASMLDRQLLRVDGAGKVEGFADLSGLCDGFINDMVVDAAGRAYIGCRNRRRGVEGPPDSVVLVQPDGRAEIAVAGMTGPNGSVITPDGATLIVAETAAARLTAFDLGRDGALENRRVFADLGTRHADGICLDAEGGVWIASPRTGEVVRVHEGGRVSEVIPLEAHTEAIACALGGDNRRTLFLLLSRMTDPSVTRGEEFSRIYRDRTQDATLRSEAWVETLPVAVPGAGWP